MNDLILNDKAGELMGEWIDENWKQCVLANLDLVKNVFYASHGDLHDARTDLRMAFERYAESQVDFDEKAQEILDSESASLSTYDLGMDDSGHKESDFY